MKFTDRSQTHSKYFQNLDNIARVKELSDEAAATCCGGAKVILYDRGDLTGNNNDNDPNNNFCEIGDSITITNSGGLCAGFDLNKTSSIAINQGMWRLYPQENFKGKPVTLSPGGYDKKALEKRGLKDNTLSSIQRVG